MEAKGPVSKRFSNAVLWVILGTVLVVAGNACAAMETWQIWSFPGGDRGPVPPDYALFGNPRLYVGSGATWFDDSDADGPDGAWALHTDEMDIFIPNYTASEPGSWKDISVVLTWKEGGESFLPKYPFVFAAPVGQYKIISYPPGEAQDLGNGWMWSSFTIRIEPNPPSEWIIIKGDICVDEVVVDTYCIPEPGTLSLLGLSVLFGLKRKRGV